MVEENGRKWEGNAHHSQSHSPHFPGGRRPSPTVPCVKHQLTAPTDGKMGICASHRHPPPRRLMRMPGAGTDGHFGGEGGEGGVPPFKRMPGTQPPPRFAGPAPKPHRRTAPAAARGSGGEGGLHRRTGEHATSAAQEQPSPRLASPTDPCRTARYRVLCRSEWPLPRVAECPGRASAYRPPGRGRQPPVLRHCTRSPTASNRCCCRS